MTTMPQALNRQSTDLVELHYLLSNASQYRWLSIYQKETLHSQVRERIGSLSYDAEYDVPIGDAVLPLPYWLTPEERKDIEGLNQYIKRQS